MQAGNSTYEDTQHATSTTYIGAFCVLLPCRVIAFKALSVENAKLQVRAECAPHVP